MRAFLEQYGMGIFTLVVIAILFGFAPILGNYIKHATNEQIASVDEIASESVRNADRPEEPKEAMDTVYACLYNNSELVLSANEITNKENVKRDFGKVQLSSNTVPTWHENAEDVLTVRFETAIKPTTCYSFFRNMKNLQNIKNLEALYTDECKNMSCLFYECQSLKTINTKYFNTKNAIDMWGMFFHCYNLENLILTNFDTKKVQDMTCMFTYCQKLKELNVFSFDTSHCTSMRDMFAGLRLTSLDISNFNTRNVTTMWHMFYSCQNLTSLDLSSFDTSKVNDMVSMFYNTPLLSTIIVSSNWTTNLAERNNKILDMFTDCGTDHVTFTK